jgi:salicylate hydroxylase
MTFHRRDLLAVIASGFPDERIHLGHRLAGFVDREDSVEAWFDNGACTSLDLLVGADGIHSPDRATIDRALAAFAGWHPQVLRIIAAAETCFIWALFDRDPLPRWSIGRTTLLGDACHPMYPFMGQGAAQAIEDGATLVACLAAGSDDPVASLRRYEKLRMPRVNRLQAMSRANKARFHMRDGAEQRARDAEWARAGDRAPESLRWLYDHDPGALESTE